MPPKDVAVSSSSSVLGVDVVFPIWGPDHRPAAVFFLKEPRRGGLQGVAQLIPATWINDTRAYLLNPEPGTYYVVAASYALNMPAQTSSTSLGGGVTASVTTGGGSLGYMAILPEEMIHQTKTTIAPSRTEFMGALRIVLGDLINAKAEFQDDVQKQVAELLRPGVTSESGLSGYLTMTWMVDLEKSSVTDAASDLEKFSLDAADDFDKSPWSQIVAGGPERR